MAKSSKGVAEQKGTIISNPPTLKSMPYKEKVSEMDKEHKMRKEGSTLGYQTPKRK